MAALSFSRWPEAIGLAAAGDPALVQEFADIARQEYLAVGIRVALHPVADLATEPRWARIFGTFGEDAELAARLVAAYIRGFQGETPGRESVFCLEQLFHAGDLRFPAEELHRIVAILERVATIVDIFLDRSAVIPEIAAESAALLASFGAGDAALLDVIFGNVNPSGKLPFELPSSMEAVRRQYPDVPYDSVHPLFPFGFGLIY